MRTSLQIMFGLFNIRVGNTRSRFESTRSEESNVRSTINSAFFDLNINSCTDMTERSSTMINIWRSYSIEAARRIRRSDRTLWLCWSKESVCHVEPLRMGMLGSVWTSLVHITTVDSARKQKWEKRDTNVGDVKRVDIKWVGTWCSSVEFENVTSLSSFYHVTQITRISLVLLSKITRKSTLKCTLGYDEYLTRASRSNTGTSRV